MSNATRSYVTAAQAGDGIRAASHPAEVRIRAALLESEALRDPDALEVRNVSGWFAIRRVLGVRRQSASVVRQDRGGKRLFSASIYDARAGGPDGGNTFRVFKRHVGVFTTVLQAHEACADACAARDERGLPENVMDDAPTHFLVRLVHPTFEGVAHAKRMSIVYEALLGIFFVSNSPLDPNSAFHCCRSMKGYTFVGGNVSNLSQFRHLGDMPFQLLLDLRTLVTHEDKPCENDIGLSHSYALAKLIKEDRCRNSNQQGVFGHFFHDLDSKSKSLLMDEYMQNVKMARGDPEILDCGHIEASVVKAGEKQDELCGSIPFQVGSDKKEPSKMQDDPATQAKGFKMLDPGGVLASKKISAFEDLEAGVTTNYYKALHAVTSSAIRLQRIYRLGHLPRTQRRIVRQHRAAVNLQRIIMGYCGRLRVANWRVVRDASVLLIQAARRRYLGKRLAVHRRYVLTALATVLQPIVRGWLAREYMSWLQHNWERAIKMQRVARGFLGRRHAHTAQIARLKLSIVLAGTIIQSMIRCFLGKVRREQLLDQLLQRLVVVPCVILVQSIWRMSLARQCLNLRRSLSYAVKEIQRCARGFLCRSLVREYSESLYQHCCAARIQGWIRGLIERDLLLKRKLKEHHFDVLIPNAIYIQAQYRGFLHRSKLQMRKAQWASAIKIQLAFRRAKVRDETKKRWQEYVTRIKRASAINIQALWRGQMARFIAYGERAKERSRRLVASRIIIKAWRQHKQFAAFQTLKEAWISKQSDLKLQHLIKERVEIHEDLGDINADIREKEEVIAWATKRIVDVCKMLDLAADRLSDLEVEAEEVDAEHMDEELILPWMIDIRDEQERLGNQRLMSMEEIRLCRVQSKRAKVSNYFECVHYNFGTVSFALCF